MSVVIRGRAEAREYVFALVERLTGAPPSGIDLIALLILCDANDLAAEAFRRGWKARELRGMSAPISMDVCFPDPELFRRCGTHWHMPLYPDGRCAEGLGR